MEEIIWGNLSPEEKKVQLYLNQKHLLDAFLERSTISKEQYEKSLKDMTEKMGMSNFGGIGTAVNGQ